MLVLGIFYLPNYLNIVQVGHTHTPESPIFALRATKRPRAINISERGKGERKMLVTVTSGQKINYFFLEGLCESAEPAAVLEALLVRPSRRTFDAADAALLEVTFDFAIKSPPFDREVDATNILP